MSLDTEVNMLKHELEQQEPPSFSLGYNEPTVYLFEMVSREDGKKKASLKCSRHVLLSETMVKCLSSLFKKTRKKCSLILLLNTRSR